ncbi:MAG: helix-turn-helix domain-containing protein [Haloplanus sp.]
MTGSIRTELGVGALDGCPVADASADTGTTVSHVARSSGRTAEGVLTEEFALDGEKPLDQSDVEKVFEFDSRTLYRFERDPGGGCVCDRIEQYGCPVSDIRARDGTLVVSFYAPDIETVQSIVDELHDWCDEIHVRKLTRTDGEADHDFAFVDRERLTARQREVLETCFEMGYFDYPKRSNAGEIAEALDIAPSTLTEHLAAAQRKVFGELVRP